VKTFSSTPISLFLCVEFDTIWSALGFPSKPWNKWTNCWDHPNCILELH
jgi:hypothetical protein